MNINTNIAKVAALVSETSRATILTALLDGRFHTASELAYMAGIKPQTASFHLTKMVQAEIIKVEKQGRHRYFGIRDSEVAQVMEQLLAIAPAMEIRSLKQSSEDKAVRLARTCYDHLAGGLGVKLTDSLLRMDVLYEEKKEFIISERGREFFAQFQMDIGKIKKKRRSFSPKCLDWSERRHHLAGSLGNALLERLLELNWIERVPKTRAIHITPEGRKRLKETFSIDIS